MPWETVTVTLRRWTAGEDAAPYFADSADGSYVEAGYVDDDIWTVEPDVVSEWS